MRNNASAVSGWEAALFCVLFRVTIFSGLVFYVLRARHTLPFCFW